MRKAMADTQTSDKSQIIQRPPLCETFELPSRKELLSLRLGDYIKLIFVSNESVERMWLKLTDRSNSERWIGSIANDPLFDPLVYGDSVEFHPLDIIGIEENRKIK